MTDDTAQPRPSLSRRLAVGPGAALLVALDVATLGFITLGFEMVASRILTPLFGSGIYTWATIISIVVAGLMAGYFIGGLVADRHRPSAWRRRSSSPGPPICSSSSS